MVAANTSREEAVTEAFRTILEADIETIGKGIFILIEEKFGKDVHFGDLLDVVESQSHLRKGIGLTKKMLGGKYDT